MDDQNHHLTIDIATRVDQYVRLRAIIKKEDDAHKEKMKPYRETLETLNNLMLEHLNTTHSESIRTESGTVYKTEKKSASLPDPAAFMDYVITNNAWDLLDRKANAKAAEDFINEHGSPPPGLKFSSAFVVGVRKA